MVRTMTARSAMYQAVEERKLGESTFVAKGSHGLEDADWDTFLQRSPLGQFQQSSIWAQAKASEGWSPVRILLTVGQNLVGGFQLLWKRSRLGRIGYVSKGPVVTPGHPGLAEFAADLLLQLT